MEVQSNYRVSSALTGYTSSYHQTSTTANRKNSTIAREAQRYNDNNDAGNDGNGSDCCKRNNRKYCEAENGEIGVNFNDDQLLDGGRLFYTYCSFLGTNTNKILNFLIGYLSKTLPSKELFNYYYIFKNPIYFLENLSIKTILFAKVNKCMS